MKMGRWCTILGVLISIGAAYFVTQFKSIMDYMQALFSFFFCAAVRHRTAGNVVEARQRPRAVFGDCSRAAVSSMAMFTLVKVDPSKLAWIALSSHAKDMAENLYRALWSCLICAAVTVIVSLFTEPKTAEELKDLARGFTDIPSDTGMPCLQAPALLGHRAGRAVCHLAVALLVGTSFRAALTPPTLYPWAARITPYQASARAE